MRTKFFNAVKKGTFSTAGELVDALEKITNTLFPENGMEYWSDNRYATAAYKKDSTLPADGDVHHVAVYVRLGNCEGRVIEVFLNLRDGGFKNLTWAKTFGSGKECWEIAEMLTEVLESIFVWREIPVILEMTDKMPRQQTWHRETNLRKKVTVDVSLDTLRVSAGDLILEDLDCRHAEENAHFTIDGYLKDWIKVLQCLKADFEVILPKTVNLPSLPGYVFLPQGGDHIEGYQVFLPGEACNDEVGDFDNLTEAICAAHRHKRRATCS